MMVGIKDDGSGKPQMCMVLNYQAVNKSTLSPDYPIPSIQVIIETLANAKDFSTLDLESGFNQIPVAKCDSPRTAFISVFGIHEFRVMPFGLERAPGTFHVNAIHEAQEGNGVAGKLDDILVYSKDEETHARIREVLRKL